MKSKLDEKIATMCNLYDRETSTESMVYIRTDVSTNHISGCCYGRKAQVIESLIVFMKSDPTFYKTLLEAIGGYVAQKGEDRTNQIARCN